MLLFRAFSTAQTAEPPLQSVTSNDELREAVWTTYLAWNRSGEKLSPEEREKAEKNGVIDISSKYWAEPIKALKAVRVYSHRVNIAVVLRIQNDVEEGMYFLIPVSSYLPVNGVDGFEFNPNPQKDGAFYSGGPVLDFKRKTGS